MSTAPISHRYLRSSTIFRRPRFGRLMRAYTRSKAAHPRPCRPATKGYAAPALRLHYQADSRRQSSLVHISYSLLVWASLASPTLTHHNAQKTRSSQTADIAPQYHYGANPCARTSPKDQDSLRYPTVSYNSIPPSSLARSIL